MSGHTEYLEPSGESPFELQPAREQKNGQERETKLSQCVSQFCQATTFSFVVLCQGLLYGLHHDMLLSFDLEWRCYIVCLLIKLEGLKSDVTL